MANHKAILSALPLLLLLTSGMTYLVSAHSAEKSPSTQQALEQLRMLQQRMSSGTETNKAKTGNVESMTASAPPVRANNQPSALNVTSSSNTMSGGENKSVPSESDKESIDSMAFDGVTEQMFPLTPEQIILLNNSIIHRNMRNHLHQERPLSLLRRHNLLICPLGQHHL